MTDSLLEVDVFQFEFNNDGAPTRLHIDDRWSSSISCEDFGLYLLMTYIEQRAKATLPPTAVFSERTKRYPIRFAESVLDLCESVNASLPALLVAMESPTAASIPTTAGDPRNHIVLRLEDGRPVDIDVNLVWLRATDLGDVESTCVDAFQDLYAAMAQDPRDSPLRDLQRQFHQVTLQHNDYAKGMYP